MVKKFNYKRFIISIVFLFVFAIGCNYTTYRTVVVEQNDTESIDPEPDYDVTLDENFQNFVTYMYMGNRSEMFGTYFNKFYMSNENYEAALEDYRTSTISAYNRRLDSLNITPPISSTAKNLLDSVIGKCSKIIQYNKSTRFLDDAVLLIGKSYYYEGEYFQAERKFNEFLSKLTKSSLYDEAILYLGKTKLKIGNTVDAETIFQNLLKTTKDNEIKSEIMQDLAVLALTRNDYRSAVEDFVSSIDFTKDKEKKAEKQYILAKIYSRYKPEEAYMQYRKASDLTSDFDLTFYSKLNEAKSLNVIGHTGESFPILDKMEGKYRDYPEMKQFVELELANTLYIEKKFNEARTKYFDVILEYPSSKVAADAYYHLAEYAEKEKSNYLYAYVDYKKVNELNAGSDFANISLKRTNTLDKYFSLLAVIKDTTKIVYPDNEPDFVNYKLMKEKEKGDEQKSRENPKGGETLPGPKGGGVSSKFLLDSLGNIDTNKNIIKTDTNVIHKQEPKEKQVPNDSLKINNPSDTLKINSKDTTGLNKTEVKKLSPEDSLLLVIHIQDSIKSVKALSKTDAYFQLAELFLYELNRTDSALYYLNLIVEDSLNPERTARALYSIASIYKNKKDDESANAVYKTIIARYPESSFANESRRVLGMNIVNLNVDSAEIIYRAAENKIQKRDYPSALSDLHKIINDYPVDSFYVKSLYSVGWIYEYIYGNKDSSISYYNKIKTKFPTSIYAASITPKLEFYSQWEKRDTTSKSLDSSGVLNDSLKTLSDSLNKIIIDSLKSVQDSLVKIKDIDEKKKAPDKNKQVQEEGSVPPPMEKPKENIKK